MLKGKRVKGALIAIGIVFIGLFIVGKVRAQSELESKLETYLQVLEIVKSDYVVKSLDDQKLVYGSIRGLLESLDDPYTRFMDPKAFKEMQVRMSGTYSGIGIYIGIKNNILTAISPIEGTPAYSAGIKAGDKILFIGDKNTKDMALEEAVSLIRGPQGSKVILKILRNGWKEAKEFIISRAKIKIEPLKAKKIDTNILYLKLNTFEDLNSGKEFEKALRNYKDTDGLIIDLRGNGGGLLQNAIDIGSMFIDKGLIVQTIDREGQREQMESTGRVLWRKPTVVLINEASASASEILAGALRDNKVATLVGTKSFGKASVQNVRRLNDGSAVLVTIAKYLTPDGEDINKKGIAPDVEVVMPTEEAGADLSNESESKDPQLQKAIGIIKKLVQKEANG